MTMCTSCTVRPGLAAAAVPLLLLLGGLGQRAEAQAPTPFVNGGGPIDIQLFRPAMDSKGYITLNASQVLGHLDISFGLVVNWSMNPLNFGGYSLGGDWCSADSSNTSGICKSGDSRSNPLIQSRLDIQNLVTGHFQGAIGLFKHFEVGLSLPVSLWNGDTDPDVKKTAGVDTGDIDAQGVGDLALHLKGRILNTSKYPVGLGVVTSVYFPTGNYEKFMSSGRFQLAPTVIVDREFFNHRLSVAVNLGFRFRFGAIKTQENAQDWNLSGDTGKWTDYRQCEDQRTGALKNCGTGWSIEENHHLTYGIGASFFIVPQRFAAVAEIVGQTGLNGGFFKEDAFNSAAEILAGFKLYLARNSYFALGAGRGLRPQTDGTHQYGSPDARIFLAFIFEPSIGDRDGDGIKDDVDKCPDDPEDFDDFEDEDGCPDPDNDRDGICDPWVDQKGEMGKYPCHGIDKCPNEPEDKDGVEDEDGCPDPDVLDRDGDGIPDDKDKCPDDPEDKDGFEDEDGCPDPDNDKDGIPDVDDLCPNDPEDKDGFEDQDGCPDPDNDKDRICDPWVSEKGLLQKYKNVCSGLDKCPNEPETYNGFEDEDGCPDKGRVIVHKGRIEILDKIYFETDKAIIKPVSFPLLDAIAATLKGNPQILLVEIQGHADERGSDDHNLKLTDDRAHSVKDYVVKKGVEEGRLQAKGYGETRPVDKRHNEEAWSKNRRVEFVILKRAE
jgi:OmpA-OmpF porin, OOP family